MDHTPALTGGTASAGEPRTALGKILEARWQYQLEVSEAGGPPRTVLFVYPVPLRAFGGHSCEVAIRPT
jgi:hypothetical protein